MHILLVEDDEYKASDISKVLENDNSRNTIERAASVTSALRAISYGRFDLVVLDMSLPTFDIAGPGGGGSPQGQGGVEVLRLAGRMKLKLPFVVVTQYPDVEIDGVDTPIAAAAAILTNIFSVRAVGCILYEFDNDKWRADLTRLAEVNGWLGR